MGEISLKYFLFQPGRPFPQVLQRSMSMPLHPPATESKLDEEKKHTHQEAGSNTQLRVHGKPPIIENQRADDALGNIVGETHLAIRSNLHQPSVQVRPVESKNDA